MLSIYYYLLSIILLYLVSKMHYILGLNHVLHVKSESIKVTSDYS